MSLVRLRNISFEKMIPSDDGTDPLGSLRMFSKEIIEMILFQKLDFNSKCNLPNKITNKKTCY